MLSASGSDAVLQTACPPRDGVRFLHVFFQLTEYPWDILEILHLHLFSMEIKGLFFCGKASNTPFLKIRFGNKQIFLC